MSDLERLYKVRFSNGEECKKDQIWIEICRFLKKYLNDDYKIVVEVGGGYCEFINHFETLADKFVLDANPLLDKYVSKGITPYVAEIEDLAKYFDVGTVSLFFMSNFLEHITKAQISQLLEDIFELLEMGGCVCILTPNIRYVGNRYWDFFDHITPITERALIEEAEAIGYKTELCIKKFIPFTTKSVLPQTKWIVRLYLALMPISSFFFGKQSLLIFRKMNRKS